MSKEGVYRDSEAACKVAPLGGDSAGAVPNRGKHGCFGCSAERATNSHVTFAEISLSGFGIPKTRHYKTHLSLKETSNMIEYVHTAHMKPKYMINTILIVS